MLRRRYRLSLLAVGGLLAPLPAVSLPARSAHAAEPTAVFHKDQDGGSGYGGGYTITNAGSAAINGWTLEFDLPANHTLGSLWNAAYTAAASHVTVKNPGWRPRIAPGASYDFGFNERLPARRPREDHRGHRRPGPVRGVRLRRRPGLRLPRRPGDHHQPAVRAGGRRR
ncbi:cellulose binding domain-containing protein [Kitasatospora cineracea]|uniref:cellulose binding domain-containing protein n=1 Tax=Kitasatospora cineracea TaxID=88074 RepID=UPI0033D20A8B